MKRFILPSLIGAISCFTINQAEACGPYFQPSYLAEETPYNLVMNKKLALQLLVENSGDLFKDFKNYPEGVSTRQAKELDFADAVNKRLKDKTKEFKQDLINKYIAYLDGEIDSISKLNLPKELLEFELYEKGARNLYQKADDIDDDMVVVMPKEWQQLLLLPPEQRYYRTTWVYFMSGNLNLGTHFGTDSYKKCEAATNNGFADTAGLARISYERAYFKGDFKKELKWWLFDIKNAKDHEFNSYLNFFRYNLSDEMCLEMMEDPILREALLLYLDYHQKDVFYKNMGKYKFRNIDILAYNVYSKGEIDKAKEYIGLLEKPTLLSYWVEAKIARHDGDVPLAIEKLNKWLELVGKVDTEASLFMRTEEYSEDAWITDVYGLLGNALVFRGDFIAAAKFLALAGQDSYDLGYVIDKYLTLDDLIALSDTHKIFSKSAFKEAFRQGKYELAMKYGTRNQKKYLQRYLEYIKQGENKAVSDDERALALYNAAKVMYYRGMELCAANTSPDYAVWKGYYSFGELEYPKWGYSKGVFPKENGNWHDFEFCNCQYKDGYWVFCEGHTKNFGAPKLPGLGAEIDFTNVPKHLRFHYRYRAAKLLLQADDLAKDKDLKALINIFGGYCMRRSVDEADIFYKRLVNGSKGTAWSVEADRIRWFPKSNTLFIEFAVPSFDNTMESVKKLMESGPVKLEDYVEPSIYDVRMYEEESDDED